MLKIISNLGQALSKTDLQAINGGRVPCWKEITVCDDSVYWEDDPSTDDDDQACHTEYVQTWC